MSTKKTQKSTKNIHLLIIAGMIIFFICWTIGSFLDLKEQIMLSEERIKILQIHFEISKYAFEKIACTIK